ncbi:papilin isoform X5 [Diabrotica virgifera virgifera]|uniref:Papilin n=1 Tax=Diabrotica virgifera virgifera TaxID=50390 RepID=A0ABM5KIV1_DIAVI|nr:papilin isoform X3 [Diabrotica virgifera virgifera]XP_050510139.1 papilin isoform X4 [Diabrotica virgifera virgifera]XP_050510140.1 papilin isoform X5 [Diabrotica virgifera virgifera]
MELFSRRYNISPLIIAVIFITFFHNVLSRHKIRHFKDRFKRQQGANLYLPGSYVTNNNDPESGPWEEWSAPGPCSRTCGGGVSTQTRKCTQGYDCRGPTARSFSCNTQDCPDMADYRSQQCAEHDNIPFEGMNYRWVPYTKGPKACELNCMPRGERFYYRHADAVVDGTRCTDEGFDVCVQGECQPVGCDRMLGSSAREDECRVCGGDGSTCRTFTNTIQMKDMQVGYNDILLIPAGATNIRVEELAPSNNYLAIRNTSAHFYLNGNWRIDFPRATDFAGTRFKYERTPQEFDAPDIITALGPTDESLFIVLLFEGSDVPVSFSYSLPTSVPPPPNETYSWIYDEFLPCTVTCGKGIQYRNVSCAGRNSLEPVQESLCDSHTKPEDVKTCNQIDCLPQWYPSEWSDCSVPCGEEGGVQTRKLVCQKVNASGIQEVVSADECYGQSKPPTEMKCNVQTLCPKWYIEPWKPCDHLCGPGKQTRKITCYKEENNRKTILTDDECDAVEKKPSTEQSCNLRPCEGVDWIASQWSGCGACGLTQETRKVLCATEDSEVQPDELCEADRKPDTIRECEMTPCEYLWYAEQWSDCSVTCGSGVQTRTIRCGRVTATGFETVDNSKCDPSKHFETVQNCTGEIEKCDGEWFTGPMGQCSKPCGGGTRSRKLVCIKDGQVADSSACGSDKIVFADEKCNDTPCSEDTILPTDITQSVDESEPTKESSQKREATTPVSATSEDLLSEETEVTSELETTTTSSVSTTPNPDDFEIVPDTNCDDGEWVEEEEEPPMQGDDPFAYDDAMLGDQPVEGSGDTTESSTDTSLFTETSISTETSLNTDTTVSSKTTEPEVLIESDLGRDVTTPKSVQTSPDSTDATIEFTGSTESPGTTIEFTGSTETPESTIEFTGSTESLGTSTEFTGSTESPGTTVEFTGSTESPGSTEAPESTTAYTGSTEAPESTTEYTGSTEAPESTTEYTGSTEAPESTTEYTGSTEAPESTTEYTGSTEAPESTTEYTGSTEAPESTTEYTGSTEAPESTTEYTGSTEAPESTTEYTGSTEAPESTTEYTGSTEAPESTTEYTGSTEAPESTTEYTGSTEAPESTTDYTGSTEAPESTTAFTGSTEAPESTTEYTGSTEAPESTTEYTGSTEAPESTTEFTGSTEAPESTTEFTGSTEAPESTTAYTGSTEAPESTTEYTGSTEAPESTTAYTGSTEAPESTTEYTGSTEAPESTTEYTGSTEAPKSTTEYTGSTEAPESTTEFTGSTEAPESTTEYTGSTEAPESTTEFTGSTEVPSSTTDFTGSTEAPESTTEFTGSTEAPESTTEFTGSTESSVSTTEFTGSTESTSEFTGSTESTSEFTGSTESTTEFTGSTESTSEFTGSTESTSEFTGSTESTTEFTGSTESTTEFTGSTESTIDYTGTTESYTSSVTDIFLPKPRLCRRRKIKKCKSTLFGCCWDNITPAEGPFDKGCPMPETCKESKYGCCDDGVSAALAPNNGGCPSSHCKETLFGCCPDNKTPSEGNDNEGCPPACFSSRYGCCNDNSTAATGFKHKGCPESTTTPLPTTESVTTEGTTESAMSTESAETTTSISTTEFSTETTLPADCGLATYRCCPDGVTTATGPGYQGCGLPCSDSKFGCCQDAKTPAHGPSGEGCCLNSTFGCCPDDITPASGPNQAGCGCERSPYGCCPDNKTSALGYYNYGCGCQYSANGCCPDRVTPAAGPDFDGCLCHTFQFGCCSDGITPAEGPREQGCGCRNTEFGCCSDEKTPASGPNQERCTCEYTKFGCCSDGVTEAKGENFEGCPVIPQNLQVGCSLAKEKGNCRNYTVKWFFDLEYGGCSRFWYGGCEGNANRYKSKEECEEICVEPQGAGRCNLPKISGPCEGYYQKYYYDKELKTCTPFIYGGCLGNNNRFETREECMDLCAQDQVQDPCQQKKDPGPCEGKHQRFYYDKELAQCQEFTYGGCKGNNNNFVTIEACKQQCAPAGERKDICSLPKYEGNCTEVNANWYYDTSRKNCAPFYYTGCYGNLNNFETREACQADCPPEVEKDICILPADTGECDRYVDRWYYDTKAKSCQQFYYGSCGGNGNNFQTQQRCQERCQSKEAPMPTPEQPVQPAPIPTQEPRPAPDTPPTFVIDMCFLPSNTGPCRNRPSNYSYYYDSRDGVCKEFVYGGCESNGNNFNSVEECLQKCGGAQDLCTLPPVRGPCNGEYPQYYYDPGTDSCQEFIYGGCTGNYNRFQDQQSCEERCKKVREPEPTYTQAPTAAVDLAACSLPYDSGNCTERFTAFYYNKEQRRCLPFIYNGCGGNSNRFNSEEQCQRQCGEFRAQDVCNMDRDPGPCRGYFIKYYYDRDTRRCEQFAYGGCRGNGNRFSSEEECAQICITHEEKKPNITAAALCRMPVDRGSCNEDIHKRWYFDDFKGDCIAFIYSGCGGNFNNFKSYQTCIDSCRELLLIPEAKPTTYMPTQLCQETFNECTTLRCAYGVDPYVDENECNRCRCHEPCANVDCLPDEQCTIDINRNRMSPQEAEFITICRLRNKPGTCPRLEITDNCERECNTDADCALQMKCCNTGCGTSCVDPPGQLVTQNLPAYTERPTDSPYEPPHVDPIEYKPEIAAPIGDQATLRCAVSGNPNPRIRWSKDNIEIDGTQPRYRIKLDQTLQIITLHKTDSGIYLCTASNGIGEAITSEVKLEVLDSEPRPVTILSEPGDEQPLVVSLNAPTTLNCFVLGYPFPAVTWWKDDSMIPFKNSEFEIRKDYSLLIHSVDLHNLGIYTCQAYNGFGKAASWSVTVKTRGPVRFHRPEDQIYSKWIVNDNEPTTTAAPVRTPPPDWEIPNTPYNPDIPPYTEPSNEIIPNTLPDAQGGRPPPSVSVPVRAQITNNDQKYPLGSDIELPCEFSGYPTPQVQWYKDGVEIYQSDKIRITETERLSVLSIEQATKGDSGTYQCEATNAYSRASSDLVISIEGMHIHPSCTDNQFFANCALIVKAQYCTHKYYAKFCCRSCTEAGLLPVDGPHIHKSKRHNTFENNLV